MNVNELILIPPNNIFYEVCALINEGTIYEEKNQIFLFTFYNYS